MSSNAASRSERATIRRVGEFLVLTGAAMVLWGLVGETREMGLCFLGAILMGIGPILALPSAPALVRIGFLFGGLFVSPVDALQQAVKGHPDVEVPGSFERGIGRLLRWAFAGFLALFSVSFIVGSWYDYQQSLRVSRTWTRAPATILRSEVRPVTGKKFEPVVVYQYEVGGRAQQASRYHCSDHMISWDRKEADEFLLSYPVGGKSTIVFDPARVTEASLIPPSGRFPWGLLVFAIYSPLVIVVLVLRQELEAILAIRRRG